MQVLSIYYTQVLIISYVQFLKVVSYAVFESGMARLGGPGGGGWGGEGPGDLPGPPHAAAALPAGYNTF